MGISRARMLRLRVQGIKCLRVLGFERFKGVGDLGGGCRVQGLEIEVPALSFKVQGIGFGV